METVYLETTFISYLVSEPSRDLIVAGHQQITREWWARGRNLFACFVSQEVWDEAAAGDPGQMAKRLQILSTLPKLPASAEAERLTGLILKSGAIPPRVARDAAHIAIATVERMDYVLTWNCRHIANPNILRRIEKVVRAQGLKMPAICTPEDLTGDES
jgi:hypothetical protein